MTQSSNKFVLSAAALAVSVLLAACGGGEAGPPPDVVAPTLTITDNVSVETATGPVTFTFTFSEDVGSSFTAEDIVVTGGTASAFTNVNATTYTLVVTPAENLASAITVSVAAAKYSDLSSNANTVASTTTQAYNTVVVVPPPVGTGTLLISWDEDPPVFTGMGAYGDALPSVELAPAGGGTGNALKIVKPANASVNWGGVFFGAPTIPFTADRKTITARVYSTRAGAVVRLKVEIQGVDGSGVEVAANQVTGAANTWTTLTWNLAGVDPTKGYNGYAITPDPDVQVSGQSYWIEDITLAGGGTVTPPPTGTGTVVADFDTVVPVVRDTSDTGGIATITTTLPAGGGSGSALELLRTSATNYALSVLNATVPFTSTRKTLSARVYSPTAGIPMKIKLEAGGPDVNTGDISANETVVVGWQTLTWTFNPDLTKTYDAIVLLPNIGNVDAAPGKKYYFDDITLLPAAVAPPAGTDTVVADFDTVVPVVRDTADTGGIATITTTLPAGGGSGSALELLRTSATNYALSVLNATVPFTSTRKTLSARVYSPTAGIPMKIKLEAGGPDVNTGDISANETVVVGWQTLTWTFNPDLTKTYDAIVLLPNIGNVDAAPGKKYYFDDFKLLAATDGGGGGTTPPGADMGSGGPQTLTIATGNVTTGDGGNTMFVAGEGLFSVNYVGSAEATPPNNLAAWPNAKTANFAGITGISGGDIGYFQDDVNLSNSSQKVDEGGWVAGTALSPLGVPNFFRFFVLKGPVSNDAYMGLYANAPNNGTVNVSGFSKIKVKVWGPAPMFERTNFNPVLEVTLTGPKVAGCTTGSGGSEITQNLTANLKNGAGGFYTMPLSGFTVKGLCGSDSGAASVLAKVARVVVTVPGTSFNYTNADGGNYPTGVNLGPIGFTNN